MYSVRRKTPLLQLSGGPQGADFPINYDDMKKFDKAVTKSIRPPVRSGR